MKDLNWDGLVKTDDTNEAAFYMLCGAKLQEIVFGKVQSNKWSKRGYTTAYKLTMSDVKIRHVRQWKDRRAVANVREYVDSRTRLKDKIHKAQKERI